MMRGTRAKFDFLECGSCGTVQLMASDLDMSAYYDNSVYGSFSPQNRSSLKTSIRRIRNEYAILGRKRLLGALLNHITPLPPDFTIIKEYATTTSKILDVGCGAGAYIRDLADIGFSNVVGY